MNRRIGMHEDPRRRHRVGVGEQLGVAARGRDIDGPVARAGHVGLAPLLDALERAGLARRGVVRAVAGADELLELVVEALVAKVALLLRDPFLQPEMRLDHELRHGVPPRF